MPEIHCFYIEASGFEVPKNKTIKTKQQKA